MDVRDRSTYAPSLESLGIETPSRLRKDDRAAVTTSDMASPRDLSDFSSAGQVLAQALQMPEIRQDRVSSLQQQIASGSYQVASQEVANAMLRNIAG
jgi:flagellar biosynthesis anti-sigma factor FlgM